MSISHYYNFDLSPYGHVLVMFDPLKSYNSTWLTHKEIGIMHLAAGIWKDNKDMRVDKNVKISIQTVQGLKLQKSLRYS